MMQIRLTKKGRELVQQHSYTTCLKGSVHGRLLIFFINNFVHDIIKSIRYQQNTTYFDSIKIYVIMYRMAYNHVQLNPETV